MSGVNTWRITAGLIVAGLSCSISAATAPASGKAALQSTRLIRDGRFVRELNLDGSWSAGLNRRYDRTLHVPGLATDPKMPTPGTLWYKRTVLLPQGEWSDATLTLKGARFAPKVYVNGVLVSSVEGGMAATVHRFALPTGNVRSFTLEIALESLRDLDPKDASAVPKADQWRSNDSSYLWDAVILRLHRKTEIGRIIPRYDAGKDTVTLDWELLHEAPDASLHMRIVDQQGKTILQKITKTAGNEKGSTTFSLQHRVKPWSPESPHLYRLISEVWIGDTLSDAREQSFGVHDFRMQGLGFQLNGEPYTVRMGTVVWHRWTRDPQAAKIAFDPEWFEKNIVLRMKALGANALRFHLGLPPEELLDLCDRDGMAVQMEWPFFHGIGASQQSMANQWQAWLDTAMRHPSVLIVHPWNETNADQLKAAESALDTLLPEYPPLIVSHRDVTPVHRYWWSLFENLGLYYDSAEQLGVPVVVDEFGGDYLDAHGNPGAYPTDFDAFQRFLGRGNTRQERLQLQADANGKVAEYWRRLGVAGFSPFCILSSPEDGNNWFLGRLDVAHPAAKPVWDAVHAAWAKKSVSLELWNRNFLPGEKVITPLWFFNDSNSADTLKTIITVKDASGSQALPAKEFSMNLKAHERKSMEITVPLPECEGEWEIAATLERQQMPAPVSRWHLRTFTPGIPKHGSELRVGIAADEIELRAMLSGLGIQTVELQDPSATVLLGGHVTWQHLQRDAEIAQTFAAAVHRDVPVVLTEVGPQPLGPGYEDSSKKTAAFADQPHLVSPETLETVKLFDGLTVSFVQRAEPESAVQPPEKDASLWANVPHGSTQLWNGLRGGLIVPSAEMNVQGLSGDALLDHWRSLGADTDRMKGVNYYAYELAGSYAFSELPNDTELQARLRTKIKFLVNDAPALANVINPDAEIKVTDLASLYRSSGNGEVQTLTVLANAGQGLVLSPVVRAGFGQGKGSVILSQLLTGGRLLPSEQAKSGDVYGLRYDPVAVQFVLNMLETAISH